ncbi:MAG: N-acetyltransferase [Pseudomonadota bacterium]
MSTQSSETIQIIPVAGKSGLAEFINAAGNFYQDDPNWVAPLRFEQNQRLTEKNPFFEHARWQAWTARRDGRIVGRVSAQIDDLYQTRHGDAVGYFGMLEADDDPALVAALLTTAEGWLQERGMHTIRGPYNLSINEECGLLVDGFDTPPYIMMGHARPWYGRHVEAAGYHKATDLLAFQIQPDFEAPRIMTRLLDRETRHVRVRCLRRKQLKAELEILRDIFNDAWAENWGFVPFTAAEFADIGELLTLLVDDSFVQIAEIDGRPVAMIVAMPNINEAIHDLGGKLLPFGWLKLLWRLKVRYPQTARVPLMGIRREFHNTPLGAALTFMVVDAVRWNLARRGIRHVEMSWILEDNTGIRGFIEACDGTISKRYRIYEKSI